MIWVGKFCLALFKEPFVSPTPKEILDKTAGLGGTLKQVSPCRRSTHMHGCGEWQGCMRMRMARSTRFGSAVPRFWLTPLLQVEMNAGRGFIHNGGV